MTTFAGGLTPAVAAGPAACTWTPELLPLPAGVLAGHVDATDHGGGYAGSISYGAGSVQGAHAVLWKNGKMTDYGNLSSPEYQNSVSVYDVNKAGTVVGAAHKESDGTPSAVHSRNGRIERLAELPNTIASMANGINDSGDIVGGVETESRWFAVRWPADRPGVVEVLTGLPDTPADASGIDEDGTVLVSVEKEGWDVPYLWKAGQARALPLPAGGYDVINRGISNGRVIGQVTTDDAFSGYVWDRDGQPRAVPRGEDVLGINRDGRIVGRTDDESWREFGVWRVTTLESTLSYTATRGIDPRVSSDDGTIAGDSWTFNGGRYEPTVWRCR